MSQFFFSESNLDYLQRLGIYEPKDISDDALEKHLIQDVRRMLHIKEIWRLSKQSDTSPGQQKDYRFPIEDVLVGLSSHDIPVAFHVTQSDNRVQFQIGTWSEDNNDIEILESSLQGAYPDIKLERINYPIMPEMTAGGFVLGLPTKKNPDPFDNALQIDRLIRGLSNTKWSLLILANPLGETIRSQFRYDVIREMREVENSVVATSAPAALERYYIELLQSVLNQLTIGEASGLWRTAVYVLGHDKNDYERIASLWHGIYSGEKSVPEALRIIKSSKISELYSTWTRVHQNPKNRIKSPGIFNYPYDYQSILTSAQLSTYIHLPNLETPGFKINMLHSFDTVPPPDTNGNLVFGKIMQRSLPLKSTDYRMDIQSLTRHVFVAGITGSGKTNTIFCLVKGASKTNIPFLVIEPSKTEYRELMKDPDITNSKNELQIFTVGDDIVSGFRINPFEVPDGTPVSQHLDLLRAVFNVSFGMWTPLPQVLEKCLHSIYEDRGWDLSIDYNRRLQDGSSRDPISFPTLSDLYHKVEQITNDLGYNKEISDNIRAALHTRINSLRTGGKGRMLDVQNSLPPELWLDKSAIFELEAMGDDDDKAFIMGLIFIRLVEHRRYHQQKQHRKEENPNNITQTCNFGNSLDLHHLVIIEEAHRLLTNASSKGSQEEANPRGKAVESFSNLLSEVRAYGQGVIVADQVPVRLAPDVIKNTNLKIAHRIVAQDDRLVLGGAMAMTEKQSLALSTLEQGNALIFAEGDDLPIMVNITKSKSKSPDAVPTNKELRSRKENFKNSELFQRYYRRHSNCADESEFGGDACESARIVCENPSFRRDLSMIALSVTKDEKALIRMWDGFQSHINSNLKLRTDRVIAMQCLLARAAHWYAFKRGSQLSWLYEDTHELEELLYSMLKTMNDITEKNADLSINDQRLDYAIKSFREKMAELHSLGKKPYPYVKCERICNGGECIYRYPVVDLISNSPSLTDKWNAAQDAFLASKNDKDEYDEKLRELIQVCQDASREIVEFSPEQQGAINQAGLCFAQHMLASLLPAVHKRRIENLIKGVLGDV